ncbi:MAG TPA: Rne/Rng family ribonuclease [Acidisarcina sp.]|nr:Rne/Rng family ribonuclease [Acidisarcina sp.]
MSKEICISSTPHETRLAIIENDELAEIYYERENEYTLAGSIYKGRVTRVLPGMQSAFVDVGLERDAFLYVTDFLEEQEDSADFERVGSAHGRREGGRESEGGREGRGREREPRESREPQAREPRESRDQQAREPRENRPPRAARPDQLAEEAAVVTPSPTEGREEEFEQGGTRRWRGRRGRRRGMRGQQPVREAEPSTQEESFDEASETYSIHAAHAEHEAEPFIAEEPRKSTHAPQSSASSAAVFLPGESLSKYGHAPAQEPEIEIEALPSNPVEPARPTPVYTTFKPSTLIETPIEWDGGNLLPGETISRYRNDVPLAPATGATHVEETPAPAEHEAEASATAADVDAHADTNVETPEEIQFEAAEEAQYEAAEEETEAVVGHAAEPTIEAEPVAEIKHPEHHHDSEQRVEPFPEETEPTHASASYRVDPTAPSEFRLVTPAEEKAEVEAPSEAAAEVQHHVDRVHVDRVLGTGELAEHSQEIPVTPAVEPASVEETAAAPVNAEENEAAAEKEQLLNKEQSLEELQDVAEDFEEIEEESGTEDSGTSVGTIQGFAPGRGVIEEEVIDEEEYDFTPLYAHSEEHDLDELEEETIDHSLTDADLGELVRDTHLDTRVNVAFHSDVATEETETEEEHEESDEESEVEAIGEDFDEESEEEAPAADGAPAPSRRSDEGRRGGRGGRHGRRRGNSGGGDRGRRSTAQMTDLPIISDLLKQGQEILVQIAKEPIAKKGARITSHIALPGRFLVFMPTVNHVGVSRKISSDEERQRLKRILISEKGENSGGFIVRTAADGASEEDLRADIRFLISLWAEIKQRSDSAKAPALIYHDLNLVERILRDQVSDNFSSIWVDSEVEYERIVRFLNRFQPSLVRRVKLYTKETPLFEQFGIQDEISKALKSKVWLKSGGSIVINQTEALVAIDINTGKYVGKTARLEDTILKTNLDAIPEIVRQIRLRDLGGIIVIDFIDMDERKNRHRVMQALEEALKADRAPSKVLQFNDFGLVAITRKRVKQSLERTLSVQCTICQGTGMVKSPVTVCNEIYVEMHKMQKTFDHGDVLLRVHPDVVKTLKDHNAKWLTELEEMISKNIIVKSDPSLHPEQFDIH